VAKGNTIDLQNTPAWALLSDHAQKNVGLKLSNLLDSNSSRYSQFSLELENLLVDFSRCLATDETLDLLVELAEQRQLHTKINDLYSGALLNCSEGRAALHTALRGAGSAEMPAATDMASVANLVAEQLELFLDFADAIRAGDRLGHTGQRFTRVINIGIGGSDLGPRLVAHALADHSEEVSVHYVAGIDGIELHDALCGAVPETTLFIICSKTFTTLETRINADAARQWLLSSLPKEAVAAHFSAISVNDTAMDEFGVAADARFRIWDWVGGRFSLWSAVGLSAAIAIGSKSFRRLLEGAAVMDEHFKIAPLRQNIPVMLGLLAIWQQNFLGVSNHVVLPYDQRLKLLPDYLQQLFMESLGKGVRVDGAPVDYTTGCAVWGGVGSNSQHSFAQLLHQGTADIQVDYIGTVNGPPMSISGGHLEGMANLIAQAESLARGQAAAEVTDALIELGCGDAEVEQLLPHKLHSGSRPSNIILLRQLDPAGLGMLLAMYEHQVFVEATIWGINPFDQWGVELGKARAMKFSKFLAEGASESLPGVGIHFLRWLK
jgi:glucose-6-phosphate isomerase